MWVCGHVTFYLALASSISRGFRSRKFRPSSSISAFIAEVTTVQLVCEYLHRSAMEDATQLSSLLSSCPGQNCCANAVNMTNARGMEMPKWAAYFSMVSSLFSCIASIVIVYIYVR